MISTKIKILTLLTSVCSITILQGCSGVNSLGAGIPTKTWLSMPAGVDMGGLGSVEQHIKTGTKAIRDKEGNVILVSGKPAMETVAIGCETRILNAKDNKGVKVTASGTSVGSLPGCPDTVTAEFDQSEATQAIHAAGTAATKAHGQVSGNIKAIGGAVGNIIKEAAGL